MDNIAAEGFRTGPHQQGSLSPMPTGIPYAGRGRQIRGSHLGAKSYRFGGSPSAGVEIARRSGLRGKLHGIADGDRIGLGKLEVTTIIVPGHSVASTCYLVDVAGRSCFFSGDTVFINGLVGILNSPGCDIGAYRRSIGKLSGLDVDALLPGLTFSRSRRPGAYRAGGQTFTEDASAAVHRYDGVKPFLVLLANSFMGDEGK